MSLFLLLPKLGVFILVCLFDVAVALFQLPFILSKCDVEVSE